MISVGLLMISLKCLQKKVKVNKSMLLASVQVNQLIPIILKKLLKKKKKRRENNIFDFHYYPIDM